MLERSSEHHHDDDHRKLTDLGIWVNAMGCSLLVSLASLICLLILPLLFWKGKPSKMVVDTLATFGAGAMLGDAFLHQLPHAFSGGHSHDHAEHDHHEVSHSHSLQDLSVGLSVLFGIVLFLLVEKAVRYVEEFSGKGGHACGIGHHHHSNHRKLKDDNTNGSTDKLLATSEGNLADEKNIQKDENLKESVVLCKRVSLNSLVADVKETDSANGGASSSCDATSSSLVFGYLNLFSDGVHNFTDGMALGSAFLLYGSVGGWSRTLFLLAHEIPQEVGDFGILVRSGFSVSKALFLNFLSALVALVGTALALLLGKDPGQSSLIEGFTAGGFIYIAVAGVLPEMNNNGSTTLKNTLIQLSSLISGIGVALCISLAE